ncbi:MAG: hypothetical protein KGL39_13980 [Patescibacteria group bacterium]|nr:hypothetical protein [Patescibacteria group bacterium]
MNTQPHAKESQSWYWPDGRPAYTVPSADGKREIAPDVRHARKLGLLPGVSRIIRQLAQPQLERWKQEQMMLAALTLPRQPGELDADFLTRVREDAEAHTQARAEEGKAVHKAIEQSLSGESFDPQWSEHVRLVRELLDTLPRPCIVDFKTKERFAPKQKLYYDEHILQLAAYKHGLSGRPISASSEWDCEHTFASSLGYGGRMDAIGLMGGVLQEGWSLISVMIAVQEPAVQHKIWTEEEAHHAWRIFTHLLAIFKLKMEST